MSNLIQDKYEISIWEDFLNSSYEEKKIELLEPSRINKYDTFFKQIYTSDEIYRINSIKEYDVVYGTFNFLYPWPLTNHILIKYTKPSLPDVTLVSITNQSYEITSNQSSSTNYYNIFNSNKNQSNYDFVKNGNNNPYIQIKVPSGKEISNLAFVIKSDISTWSELNVFGSNDNSNWEKVATFEPKEPSLEGSYIRNSNLDLVYAFYDCDTLNNSYIHNYNKNLKYRYIKWEFTPKTEISAVKLGQIGFVDNLWLSEIVGVLNETVIINGNSEIIRKYPEKKISSSRFLFLEPSSSIIDSYQNLTSQKIKINKNSGYGKIYETDYQRLINFEYYDERKIAIIGSNTMTTQFRAVEPKLVENINGTNTFSFKLFYSYVNNETGEEEINPFLSLLFNERKIKVFWRDKWYHLVIKAIDENSEDKSITYTCKDLFINELSKSGFNLEFNTELENNQGTVQDLAAKILDGSDWSLAPNQDSIREKREEAVYEVTSTEKLNNFTAKKCLDDSTVSITQNDNNLILLYHSVIKNKDKYLQFFYNYGNDFEKEESSLLAKEGDCLYVDIDRWEEQSHCDSIKTISWKTIGVDTPAEYISFIEDVLEDGDYTFKVKTNKFNLNTVSNETEMLALTTAIRGDIATRTDLNKSYILTNSAPTLLASWLEVSLSTLTEKNTVSIDLTVAKNTTSASIADLLNTALNANPILEICFSAITKTLQGYPTVELSVASGVSQYEYLDIELINKTYLTAIIKNGNTDVPIIRVKKDKGVSSNYRAERLVRSKVTSFDTLTNKYVSHYLDGDTLVYGYTETKYYGPKIVNNLLVNNKNFSSTVGWTGINISSKMVLVSGTGGSSIYRGLLKIDGTEDSLNDTLVFNNGIKSSVSFLEEGFQEGEEFIFRFKAHNNLASAPTTLDNYFVLRPDYIVPKICKYTYVNNFYVPVDEDDYFDVSDEPTFNEETGWYEYTLTCSKTVTKNELINNNIGFFLSVKAGTAFWLEEVELFKLVEIHNSHGELETIYPGEVGKNSLAKTFYKYYNANQSIKSMDELVYLYNADTDTTIYTPIYNNFEKFRSISEKNSNRFNLLQKLAETFQCFIKFTIEQEENGKIKLEEGSPKKYISFHEELGERRSYGFIYNIDLKSVSRTINSDQITTKMIVPYNVNEFAKNGYCTISRSKENPSRESFLLNFDYFINQGVLSREQVNKDLFLDEKGGLGYFTNLHNYNIQSEQISDEMTVKNLDLLEKESILKEKKLLYQATLEDITQIRSSIDAATKVVCGNNTNAYVGDAVITGNIRVDLGENLLSQDALATKTATEIASLETAITDLKTFISEAEIKIAEFKTFTDKAHADFYAKYSKYIQEGSWNSSEYTDDDLYYLDAEKTLRTSSRPQITYNISVLRLTALEDFKYKKFNVGDITYIQDPEFFGYVDIDGVKTPYKETVTVAEITSNFESPENDSYQIQNYKTQFEDLFQRIAASAQALQFATGDYQRAAKAFSNNGSINPTIIQNSLLEHKDLTIKPSDRSVEIGSNGFVTRDLHSFNNQIRLSGGSLSISEDGGSTWRNVLSAGGILPQSLGNGYIDLSKVELIDSVGDHPNIRTNVVYLNQNTPEYIIEDRDTTIVFAYNASNQTAKLPKTKGKGRKILVRNLSFSSLIINRYDNTDTIDGGGSLTVSANGIARLQDVASGVWITT